MLKLLTIFLGWTFFLVFLSINVRTLLTFSAKYDYHRQAIYASLKETFMSDHSGDALAVTFAPPETFSTRSQAPSYWAAPVSSRECLT